MQDLPGRNFFCAVVRFCAVWFALVNIAHAAVVINEVHYDPDVNTEPVEFIELVNTAATPVDLSGWSFTAGVSYTFPGGTTLQANGYIVVGENPAAIQSKFGISGVLGPWTGKLANEGETITLRNAGGSVVDEVDYQSGFPWPTTPDGAGPSMELINPAFDNSLGGNWRPSGGYVGGTLVTLIAEEEAWRYRKGTSEASSPIGNWRLDGFVEDATWFTGGLPIGYGEGLVVTNLPDMQNGYSSLYLRKTFNVANPAQIASLNLQALYDDGINVWINGTLVLRNNTPSDNPPYNALASVNPGADDLSYRDYALPNPAGYLVAGTNVIAVQLLNATLGSSDATFDCRLVNTPTANPTPGAQNSVFGNSAPPALRQLDHSPQMPAAGQAVTITIKATAPSGITSVKLKYQTVEPGAYIRLTDPEWITNWSADQTMRDDGTNGDAVAGDSIYTLVLPGSLQTHRRLIRYRITAVAGNGQTIAAPYSDDPSYNFAYFCYNGIPAWSGAIDPATFTSDPAEKIKHTYDTTVMNSVQPLHLIAREADVVGSQWTTPIATARITWIEGAVVYNGEVYDHVQYRIRGHGSIRRSGKNKWKIRFNRGNWLKMRDDYGNRFPSKWRMLTITTGTNTWWRMSQSTEGMMLNEPLSMRLHELAGVPASKTSMFHFRVIDNSVETNPTDQYEGDFWGLYIAIERPDGRFLGDRDMPDGNLYSIASGQPDQFNQGSTQVTDNSDFIAFSNTTTGYNKPAGSRQPTSWWRANFNLDNYYRSKAISDATNNADRQGPTSNTSFGNNYILYRNPITSHWWVMPWDLDRSFEYGRSHDWPTPPLKPSPDPNSPTFRNEHERLFFCFDDPALWIEYQNVARELQDLLLNADEGARLVDEYAAFITKSSGGRNFVEANRAMWEYHPRVVATGRHGKFYVNNAALDSLGGQNFTGMVEYWKRFIQPQSVEALMPPITTIPVLAFGGKLVSNDVFDANIPTTPTIAYIGGPGFPSNDLRFESSNFADPQGVGTFAAMKWRIGEISVPGSPEFNANDWQKYEVEPLWDSGELPVFNNQIQIPPAGLKVAHTYRVRVKMKDNTGRWSNWSAPVQFKLSGPSLAATVRDSLRVTELMYAPTTGAGEDEFIELRNIGTTALDLSNMTFTSGITFTFPAGTTLAAGQYLVLTRAANVATFRSAYNVPAGVQVLQWTTGRLDNSGEQVTLKTLAGGDTIFTFSYDNSRGWPLPPQGTGHSLVALPASFANQHNGSLDYFGNWTSSVFMMGSPGRDEPVEPASLRINEFDSHTDPPPPASANDWVELHNPTGASISLNNNWFLSDDLANLKKYAFGSFAIAAGDYRAIDEATGSPPSPPLSFGLNKAGERILLSFLPGNAQDRVVDSLRFEGQANGPTTGRFPNASPWLHVMNNTRGSANTAPPGHPVITEIMYHPLDDLPTSEFIEIHNPTSQPVAFQTNDDTVRGWRISGEVTYNFPSNLVLQPGEHIVVVGFNPSDSGALNAFKTKYGVPGNPRFFGPWTDNADATPFLSNHLGRISLEKAQAGDPPDLPSNISWIVVDETIYFDQTPFPAAADGGGPSLHRIVNADHGMDPANWRASSANPGRSNQTAAGAWMLYDEVKH